MCGKKQPTFGSSVNIYNICNIEFLRFDGRLEIIQNILKIYQQSLDIIRLEENYGNK